MNETCGATPFNFTLFIAGEDNDEIVTHLKVRKIFPILRQVAGSISLIASSILVWNILRSHIGLSSTFNRLLFGLCVADIMSSCAHMLSTVMVPKEVDYFYWNAHGNTATCNLQGFLHIIGSSATLYNCSICIYYLTIVKYNKNDEYIRKKIEPWLHGVSILYPLSGAILGIVMKAMNPWGSLCTIKTYLPPHCAGCEYGQIRDETGFNIPCGRGGAHAPLLFIIFVAPIVVVSPIFIAINLSLIYQTVAKNSRTMQRYGAGSLVTTTEGNSSGWSLDSVVHCCLPCRKHSEGRNQESMRQIWYRNIAYALAWFLTFVFFLIHQIMMRLGAGIPLFLILLEAFFLPLQGLFNFIIYTYPKVVKAKRNNTTWFEAFVTALMSKGKRRGDGSRPNPLNDFRPSVVSRTSFFFRSIKLRMLRFSTARGSSRSINNIVANTSIGEDVKLDESTSSSKMASYTNQDLKLEDGDGHIAKFPIRLCDTQNPSTGRLFGNRHIEFDAGDADADADADDIYKHPEQVTNNEEVTCCERSSNAGGSDESTIDKDSNRRQRSVRFE